MYGLSDVLQIPLIKIDAVESAVQSRMTLSIQPPYEELNQALLCAAKYFAFGDIALVYDGTFFFRCSDQFSPINLSLEIDQYIGVVNGKIRDSPRRRDPCLKIRARDSSDFWTKQEKSEPPRLGRRRCRDSEIWLKTHDFLGTIRTIGVNTFPIQSVYMQDKNSERAAGKRYMFYSALPGESRILFQSGGGDKNFSQLDYKQRGRKKAEDERKFPRKSRTFNKLLFYQILRCYVTQEECVLRTDLWLFFTRRPDHTWKRVPQ